MCCMALHAGLMSYLMAAPPSAGCPQPQANPPHIGKQKLNTAWHVAGATMALSLVG